MRAKRGWCRVPECSRPICEWAMSTWRKLIITSIYPESECALQSPAGDCTWDNCRVVQICSIISVVKLLDPGDCSGLFDRTTYDSKTWSPTKAEDNVLAVIERAMERGFLSVTAIITKLSVRCDVFVSNRGRKIRGAGHVALLDNRQTFRVIEWYPRKETTTRPTSEKTTLILRNMASRGWRQVAVDVGLGMDVMCPACGCVESRASL